ncbi:MAG: LON peptidase substrate-binding domain-containing protein [Sphingomonadaceae bacterium]
MRSGSVQRLSIFPLPGALLFPRLNLPLHIFEPRYRSLVSDALARDRRIAMIQPRDDALVPELFDIGCVGRISAVEALDDGRYNIVLEGLSRFRIRKEIDASTPFRQVEADCAGFTDDPGETLPHILRADFEGEAKRFADARGIVLDWDGLLSLDDETLINGSAQVAPFDVASKQALLEAPTLVDRADLLVQLLRFFREQGEGESRVTLQ